MDLITMFLIAVGLSMDAFAVSVCKGLSETEYKLRYSMICGTWFGIFQALMPAAGYLIGIHFKDYITAFDHWIAFILLGFIGFGMIKGALGGAEDKTISSFAPKEMIVLAAATSVDALAIGITFAFLSVNIYTAVLLIGICTFIISSLGVKIGAVFGARYKSKAELAGGIILILLGIKILIEHLAGD